MPGDCADSVHQSAGDSYKLFGNTPTTGKRKGRTAFNYGRKVVHQGMLHQMIHLNEFDEQTDYSLLKSHLQHK